MAVEFRTGFLGFNKDDVLNYVHKKDYELKALSKELNTQIDGLKAELDALKTEYNDALVTVATLSFENSELKTKVAEFEAKAAEIEALSEKIGKLYLVSKTTANTIVKKAQENSELVARQTAEQIESLEAGKQSLKEITENILTASQGFVNNLETINESLDNTKSAISKNEEEKIEVSEEFAELYAKLG